MIGEAGRSAIALTADNPAPTRTPPGLLRQHPPGEDADLTALTSRPANGYDPLDILCQATGSC